MSIYESIWLYEMHRDSCYHLYMERFSKNSSAYCSVWEVGQNIALPIKNINGFGLSYLARYLNKGTKI